jgi:hypothetical protein
MAVNPHLSVKINHSGSPSAGPLEGGESMMWLQGHHIDFIKSITPVISQT